MKPRERYLTGAVKEDALKDGKMVFLSGPRQTGKRTLARALLKSPQNEFSWDSVEFRRSWTRSPAAALAERGPGPVLLDEIHKDRSWKSKLKGLYDTKRSLEIIATGSARLDIFRRGGDSLLGRYVPYRVHPFSIGETARPASPDSILERGSVSFPLSDVLKLGTFPEPLLAASEAKARRWSRLRRERIMREDIRDLRNIQNLRQLELLSEMLPERVGSVLSLNSLREDLHAAHDTVREWMEVLSSVYFCFLVPPYSRRISRAVRQERKLYLFDFLEVSGEGARFENLVALHLLKSCHFWTDTAQGDFALHFVRTRDGREIDFLITKDKQPWMIVEAKSSRQDPSPALTWLAALLKTKLNFQLVLTRGVDRNFPDTHVRVLSAEKFLCGLV